MPKQKASSAAQRLRRTLRPPRRSAAKHAAIASPWRLRKSQGLQILELEPFARFPWLIHGFSTRPGGLSQLESEKVLNLGHMEWDTCDAVAKNRGKFQSALGASDHQLFPLKQIHSDLMRFFSPQDDGASKGDASATNRPGILLGIQTADCVPILLVDPK